MDAQRAWQYELGTRGATIDQRLNWDFTAYDIKMRKKILAANVQVTGGGIQSTFLNPNNTRHTGLEMGSGYVLTRGLFANEGRGDALAMRTAFTWQRVVFSQDVFGATAAGPNSLIAKSGLFLKGGRSPR